MSSALTEKPDAETLPKTNVSSTLLNGHYMPPPADEDGKLWVRTSALIQGDIHALYALWRDVERAPEWQEELVEVRRTGETTSHWTLKTGDTTVEWDAETLNAEPGRRIAWKSTGGDVDQAGEVMFEEAPAGRGVFVTVLQEFRMGKVASLWKTFTGRSPKQRVIEDLRHFKALAETGEIPRSQGASHGDRGATGGMKRSMYGETVPTPAGQA